MARELCRIEMADFLNKSSEIEYKFSCLTCRTHLYLWPSRCCGEVKATYVCASCGERWQ